MTSTQVIRVLKQYGYAAAHVHAVQKGYRNESYAVDVEDHTMLNLIVYKSEPGILTRIHNAQYIADHLARKDFVVRTQVDGRLMCVRGTRGTQYAGLYTYLLGTTIPWEAYTMGHIKQLAATMSNMHAALYDLERGALPLITDELLALSKRMESYFGRSEVETAIRQKLSLKVPLPFQRYRNLLRFLAGQAGAQPLHMDFVRGNILFTPGTTEVAGILDFEKAAWGLPVYDVARTLAFLLVDCKYKSEAQIRKYFLRSGYNKRGASHLPTGRVLELLVDFFLLHDFYKFLRHNPYESLGQNEHYVRTRNLLLGRKIISEE